MKLPAIISDRKARDELKDKVEVVLAVVCITQFAYSKIKKHNNPQPTPDQENNS